MIEINTFDPVRDAAIATEIQQHLAPRLAELTTEFVNLAHLKLLGEGWQEAQAGAIIVHALSLFTTDVLNGNVGQETIDQAIDHGRREFFADLFDDQLAEGTDRRTAFLVLAALDRENAERAGEPVTNYPRAWIDLAAAAVEAAALRGESSRAQIAEGFSALAEAGRAAARRDTP